MKNWESPAAFAKPSSEWTRISLVRAVNLFNTSDFSYSIYDVTLKERIKYRHLGQTNLLLTAGWIDGIAPYGRLYNGRGTRSTDLFVDNYFQTMGLYEFTATKYASVFLSHNFGNILLNKWFSKPELVLYQNMGIGQLENKDAHVGLSLQDFSQGFVESGLGQILQLSAATQPLPATRQSRYASPSVRCESKGIWPRISL